MMDVSSLQTGFIDLVCLQPDCIVDVDSDGSRIAGYRAFVGTIGVIQRSCEGSGVRRREIQ